MSSQEVPLAHSKHPKGLYVLFFTEMWERFSFYLMIGILYQYLTDAEKGGLGWDGKRAAALVGSYIALVYFTPFLGGLIADRFLGCRLTIVLGGIAMAIGHVLLAFPETYMLYLALLFLIVGNGLFKPNVSAMVGNLYTPDSPLRDSAYNFFYMGINIGAFSCNIIAALVRNKYGWHWAFATAGFGMVLGLIVFLLFQKHIRHADKTAAERRAAPENQGSIMPLFLYCLGPAALLGVIGYFTPIGGLNPQTRAFIFACVPAIGFFIWVWSRLKVPAERARVGALLTIYGVVVIFWAIFHQNTTALTAWAVESTDRMPGGVVSPLIALSEDFTESAPPSYFKNAGPKTPRPDKAMYQVVSPEEWKALKEAGKLRVEDGKPYPVTQQMLDEVYARAGSETPALEPGKNLKLVNAELFQSINPGFVILFTPLVVGLFALLRRRKKEPSTPAKIGIGLVLTAASTLVMLGAVLASHDAQADKASAWWLVGTYGVITVGELCLSPMGLSLVSKMSPLHIRSFMMGGWFLSTSIGNKVSGIFGEVYHEWPHTTFFIVCGACAGVAAAALFVLLPWLRRQMAEEPTGGPDALPPNGKPNGHNPRRNAPNGGDRATL
jgi:POT family proton-dependent oligopeptide transporter